MMNNLFVKVLAVVLLGLTTIHGAVLSMHDLAAQKLMAPSPSASKMMVQNIESLDVSSANTTIQWYAALSIGNVYQETVDLNAPIFEELLDLLETSTYGSAVAYFAQTSVLTDTDTWTLILGVEFNTSSTQAGLENFSMEEMFYNVTGELVAQENEIYTQLKAYANANSVTYMVDISTLLITILSVWPAGGRASFPGARISTGAFAGIVIGITLGFIALVAVVLLFINAVNLRATEGVHPKSESAVKVELTEV